MLYTAAIWIQLTVIILCFICIFIMAEKRNNSYTHIMLLAFVCGIVQNVGYYFELTSTDVQSGFRAIQIEYCGGAFIVTLIVLFIFKYCNHPVSLIIKYLMILEGIIVIIGLNTWEKNHFFYTSIDYDTTSSFPHFVIGHGWMFTIFMSITMLELLLCLFIIILSFMRAKQAHMKRNYGILIGVISVPLMGFILSVLGFMGGYDATPATTGLGVALFGFAIAMDHVFDVSNIAAERLIEDMSDAVIVINDEEGFEKANTKAKELFPELKNMKPGTSISETRISYLFDEYKRNEIVIGDSSFDVHITPVLTKGHPIGKSAVLFDITSNKKQIEKMRELMEAADDANKAKSAFLANVSHEIRTPINVILGMSEVLYRDYRNNQTNEYVLNIRNSAETLLALINDVLDFSKIESGKMSIINNEYDLKKLLQELAGVYKFRCEKKGLHFDILVPKDLPRFFVGDEIRIRQILNNLLSNSLKYTERGSICLTVSGKFRTDSEMDILIKVEDTGIGIEKEDQSKLFMDFSRVNLKKTNSIQGTGLGLKITKQLVDLMNGAINFKSVYGEGTIFSVVIPQNVSEIKTEKIDRILDKVDEGQVYEADFIAPDAKVLVVDDTKTNLIVVKELLKKTQVNIKCITSGEECIELVKENYYDIIFLDHRMPGMDGIETYEKMQNMSHKCEKTPVIMLTANAIGDARDYYLSKNFADFLSKPVTSKQLIEMLMKYLPGDLIKYK